MRLAGAGLLALLLLSLLLPSMAQAKELRRSLFFIRPLLMGDAYTAVGDEASTIFHNPAGLARLPAGSVELFNPQLGMSKLLNDALVDPDVINDEYGNLSSEDFGKLLGTTLYVDLQLRLPIVTSADDNGAWGLAAEALTFTEVLGNPVLPALHVEYFYDQILFNAYAYRLNPQLTVGITPKIINRVGLSKTFSFGELFAAGDELSLENHPDFQTLSDGTSYVGLGLDWGFIYDLPWWPGWHPRLGVSALNMGGVRDSKLTGIEFGSKDQSFDEPIGGVLPQINTIGFAVSPVFTGVRYTISFDYVDYTHSVLPGDDMLLRTRLGVEAAIGVREDGSGLFSILAGFNATHPSFGILSRVWIFEVGFGTYTVELGEEPGDAPDDRIVWIFGFRF